MQVRETEIVDRLAVATETGQPATRFAQIKATRDSTDVALLVSLICGKILFFFAM